jgi:hypothetical protein
LFPYEKGILLGNSVAIIKILKRILALAGLLLLLASCGEAPSASLSPVSGSNTPMTSASNGAASTPSGGSVAPVSIADQHFSLKEFSDFGIFGSYTRFAIALHPNAVIDIDYVYQDKGSQSYSFRLKANQSIGGVSHDLLVIEGVTSVNELQGPILLAKAYFFYQADDAQIRYQSEETYSENSQSYGLITATCVRD